MFRYKVQNRLREMRENQRITQEGLATELGVSRQTIISIEKGRYIPSLVLAFKIAGYFHCSIEDIFRLEE